MRAAGSCTCKHSGTVNNNVSANYTYDKANNRTNLNVVSPNSPPP